MSRKRQTRAKQHTHAHKPTPTFLLDLPLQVTPGQAKRLRAHLEAARQIYNAVLSEGQRTTAPYASRPRLASRPCYPSSAEAGTAACLWDAATAAWVFGICAARRRERLELWVDR